jgi:hypothetical protein
MCGHLIKTASNFCRIRRKKISENNMDPKALTNLYINKILYYKYDY